MQSPAQSRYGLSRGHALASATQRVSCAVQGGGASGTFRARRGDGLCSDNHIHYIQSNNSVKKGSSLRRKARRPVMFMRCTTRLIILALALCISSPSSALAFQVNDGESGNGADFPGDEWPPSAPTVASASPRKHSTMPPLEPLEGKSNGGGSKKGGTIPGPSGGPATVAPAPRRTGAGAATTITSTATSTSTSTSTGGGGDGSGGGGSGDGSTDDDGSGAKSGDGSTTVSTASTTTTTATTTSTAGDTTATTATTATSTSTSTSARSATTSGAQASNSTTTTTKSDADDDDVSTTATTTATATATATSTATTTSAGARPDANTTTATSTATPTPTSTASSTADPTAITTASSAAGGNGNGNATNSTNTTTVGTTNTTTTTVTTTTTTATTVPTTTLKRERLAKCHNNTKSRLQHLEPVVRRYPWLYFSDRSANSNSFSTYKFKFCPRPGKLSKARHDLLKFKQEGGAGSAGGGVGAGLGDTAEETAEAELERRTRDGHHILDGNDDDYNDDDGFNYLYNATVNISYAEGCEFPCSYRDDTDTEHYDERSGVAFGCTRIESMERDRPWIACNGTDDDAVLCQIGGFLGAVANASTTNPSGDVSKVALATRAGEDVTCHHYTDPDFWSPENTQHHAKNNGTTDLNGSFWSVAQIHRQLVSKRQEAVLLEETTALLQALEAMASSDEGKLSREVCDVLVASNAFNADWLQCGTKNKAGQSNQTFAGLLKAVIAPTVAQASDEANETRVVQMKTKYICDWKETGVPKATSAITDLTGTGPGKCWDEAGTTKCTQIDIEVSHACCCRYNPAFDDSIDDQGDYDSKNFHTCFANYSALQANDHTKDKCDDYRNKEKVYLMFAAIPVILLLWISERWEQRHQKTLFVSANSWFSDLVCMFGLIPPLNFMENRKGSIIVSCFLGTLASLIFREVAIPTRQGFQGALYWLFLLYPMFICRTATNKKLGSFLGVCYCVMFAYLLSFQLVCNFMADQPDQAIYNFIPAVFCNSFVAWYLWRLLRKSSMKWSVWQNYDHRSMVELLFIPPEKHDEEIEEQAKKKRWWEGGGWFESKQRKEWALAVLHFRTSPRMLSMIIMCICMLTNFLILCGFKLRELKAAFEFELSRGLCVSGTDASTGEKLLYQRFSATSSTSTILFDSVRDALHLQIDDCMKVDKVVRAFETTVLMAGVISAIMHVLSLANMVVCYRKHMLRFYKGPYVALTDALKYASYQVIFMIAGWCFGTLILVLIFMFITVSIVLPYTGDVHVDIGLGADFWKSIYYSLIWENGTIGLLTLSIILYAMLMGVVWVFFLDKKVPFAIRNRQFWDIFDLFQTVASFIVGFFMFARRLLTLIIFGFLFISRLDKPLVPRGYEWIDPGFACYQGFLLVELYYSNPVMLTFVQLLLEEHTAEGQRGREHASANSQRGAHDDDVPMLGEDLELRDIVGVSRSVSGDGGGGGGGPVSRSNSDSSPSRPIRRRNRRSASSTTGGVSRAVKRWQLFYTLVRNPELIELRKHRGTWDDEKQRLSLRPRGKSFLTGAEGGHNELFVEEQRAIAHRRRSVQGSPTRPAKKRSSSTLRKILGSKIANTLLGDDLGGFSAVTMERHDSSTLYRNPVQIAAMPAQNEEDDELDV